MLILTKFFFASLILQQICNGYYKKLTFAERNARNDFLITKFFNY